MSEHFITKINLENYKKLNFVVRYDLRSTNYSINVKKNTF